MLLDTSLELWLGRDAAKDAVASLVKANVPFSFRTYRAYDIDDPLLLHEWAPGRHYLPEMREINAEGEPVLTPSALRCLRSQTDRRSPKKLTVAIDRHLRPPVDPRVVQSGR